MLGGKEGMVGEEKEVTSPLKTPTRGLRGGTQKKLSLEGSEGEKGGVGKAEACPPPKAGGGVEGVRDVVAKGAEIPMGNPGQGSAKQCGGVADSITQVADPAIVNSAMQIDGEVVSTTGEASAVDEGKKKLKGTYKRRERKMDRGHQSEMMAMGGKRSCEQMVATGGEHLSKKHKLGVVELGPRCLNGAGLSGCPMKICAWNSRGLGNGPAVRGLLDFQKREDPDVLFLLETKLDKRRLE